MDTKNLERSIKTIIKTGEGYGPEFLPVLKKTKIILKRINKGKPTSDNYFQLGKLCLQLEDSTLALEAFIAGFNLNNTDVNCGTYSALLFEQNNQWDNALAIYTLINELNPENVLIAERMLFILYSQKDIRRVLTTCNYFLDKKLFYPSIYEYLARTYFDCGKTDKAIEHIKNAISLDKNNADYVNQLIDYSYREKDFDTVFELQEHILNGQSVPLPIKLILANSLAEVGKLKDSRCYFVKILKEEKDDKNTILATIALFHMKYEMKIGKGRFINNYVLKREPDNTDVLTNIALISDDETALKAYERVLVISPDKPSFRANYGSRLLQTGNLAKGFEYYESRIDKINPFLVGRLNYPQNIKDKNIFIWNEQGIGDFFIWSWLFKFLGEDNIQAKIQCDTRLLKMMKQSFPKLKFTDEMPIDVFMNNTLADYDTEMVYVSLGKYYIPQIVQAQNEYDQKTCFDGHIKVDDSKLQYWKSRLKKYTSKKIVGVCWRSGLLGNMRDSSYLVVQNLIDTFIDLDCYVVNLQYNYTEDEIDLIQDSLGERFINFSGIDLKDDLDELAALMLNLDLIYSVNTAVMTLAGAIGAKVLTPGGVGTLGKPFNVMLPSVKSIVGRKGMRNDSSHYSAEIAKALNI